MTDIRKAAEQAREAMRRISASLPPVRFDSKGHWIGALDGRDIDSLRGAITFLTTALEQPQAEFDHATQTEGSPKLTPNPQAEPVAWADKAMELSTDFAVESLRVGSSERHDTILSNGVASWKTIALRERREAARERLREHLYTAAPAQAERKPLTDAAIQARFTATYRGTNSTALAASSFEAGVRWAEQQHGIGGEA